MGRIYGLKNDGEKAIHYLDKADALRAAQLALRSDPRFAFPYYWSPFILVGDWR